MSNDFCLPNIRLIDEVVHYQVASDAYSGLPFFPSGMISFNTGRASIRINDRNFTSTCLFCIAADPAIRTIEKEEGEVVLVILRPGAFYRLLGIDGARHGGGIIEADPDRFAALFGILDALDRAGTGLAERISVLDAEFYSLAKCANPPGLGEKFRLVADWTKGNIRVAEAAERLGVSVRTLERECRRRFARTPKRILRGIRIFHAMAPCSGQLGPIRWNSLDPAALYSDQSHFLREYRSLSGLSPTEMHQQFERSDEGPVFHSRSEISISGRGDHPEIAAEYEKNARYSYHRTQIVRELGLDDWVFSEK